MYVTAFIALTVLFLYGGDPFHGVKAYHMNEKEDLKDDLESEIASLKDVYRIIEKEDLKDDLAPEIASLEDEYRIIEKEDLKDDLAPEIASLKDAYHIIEKEVLKDDLTPELAFLEETQGIEIMNDEEGGYHEYTERPCPDNNAVYVGKKFMEDTAGKWEDCGAKCNEAKKCKYFTWNKNTKKCQLLLWKKILIRSDSAGRSGMKGCPKPCEESSCSVCHWHGWDPFGKCSKECGGGRQSRRRGQGWSFANYIAECKGPNTEYRDCNTESCKSEWEKSSCQWRTSLKGGWGEEVACERHEIAVGSCQSGKNKDCEHVDGRDYPALLFCCKRATWGATKKSLDFTNDCNGLRRGANAGTNMECESGGDFPAIGVLCSSGGNKDCKMGGWRIPDVHHYIRCCRLHKFKIYSDGCEWLSTSGWGSKLVCPVGKIMVGECGSGMYKDCGINSDKTHMIKCCPFGREA